MPAPAVHPAEAVVKSQLMRIEPAQLYLQEVIHLLKSADLPANDLPTGLANFLVAILDNEIVGVAGMETYGNFGLLRSLAVWPSHRKQGIATYLLNKIELLSREKELEALYLFTETTAGYFKTRGFSTVEREFIPNELKESSQFRYVCPSSAFAMHKSLK